MTLKELSDRLDKIADNLDRVQNSLLTETKLIEAIQFETKLQNAAENIAGVLEKLKINPDDIMLSDRLRSYQNRYREIQERRSETRDLQLALKNFIIDVTKEK